MRLLIAQDDEVMAALDWTALLYYISQHFDSTYKSIKILMK